MAPDSYVRCVVRGRLTTSSFLHVGAGLSTSEATLETEGPDKRRIIPDVARVAVDALGRACIPGSTLRGAILSRLRDVDALIAESLQGKTDRARRLFLRAAHTPESASPTVCDDPAKLVDFVSMAAINRWRRSAADDMLRTIEAVPPGVTFDVWLGLERTTLDEIGCLLVALDEPAQSGRPLRLGAFATAGWGRLTWTCDDVKVLTPSGVRTWLESSTSDPSRQGWDLCDEIVPRDVLEAIKTQITGRPTSRAVAIDLTLVSETTFLTADHRPHVRNRRDERGSTVARTVRLDNDDTGRVWLNGQSVKGALRSQFERILRTRGIPCCDPTWDRHAPEVTGVAKRTDNTLAPPRCEPIRAIGDLDDADALCPACRVFGAGGWGSTIHASPFTAEASTVIRDYVAIDRFIGGGRDRLKFRAYLADRPRLKGTLQIDVKRLTMATTKGRLSFDAAAGALLHLFRDLAEGDVSLGAGRSKGMGWFTVSEPSCRVPADAEASSRSVASELARVLKGEGSGAPVSSPTALAWLAAFDAAADPSALPPAPEWSSLQSAGSVEAAAPAPPAGSYHPYHFVPIGALPENLQVDANAFPDLPHIAHDRYVSDAYSGEFTVSLETRTAMFVGGYQCSGDETPRTVVPYKIGACPAIPGSSLRGLLSSLYEPATGSAMRVLDAKQQYSFRKMAGDALPILGRISETGDSVIPWARNPMSRKVHKDLAELRGWMKCGPGSLPDVYCLFSEERGPHLPESRRYKGSTETHEIRVEATAPRGVKALALDAVAKDRFHRIAKDCTDTSRDEEPVRPYGPVGQDRSSDGQHYELKANDFVFIDTRDGRTVSDIALAQIWRSEMAEPLDAVIKKIDPNLLPFDADRTRLTMAEMLFGFVDEAKPKPDVTPRRHWLQAYASRLEVGDAVMIAGPGEPFESEGVLQILSSPKPPSPAYYFDPVGSDQLDGPYKALANLPVPRPRGRKMYLHSTRAKAWAGGIRAPWETGDAKDLPDQKTRVKCVKKGCTFKFRIRFQNLTPQELDALCYVIQPSATFCHKIGMGKPLGLGSVSLRASAVSRIDRVERYSTSGFQQRRAVELVEGGQAASWIQGRADHWRRKTAPKELRDALLAIERLGSTWVTETRYPTTRKQFATGKLETELFEWPSANRKVDQTMATPANFAGGQYLRPMKQGLTPLPWKCYVVVVCGEIAKGQVRPYITGKLREASHVEYAKALEDLGTFAGLVEAGSVVYIVGKPTDIPADLVGQNLPGIDYRLVPVRSLSAAPTAQGPATGRDRDPDGSMLDKLEKALKLGARV